MDHGVWIAIEGIDDVGKTTLARSLVSILNQNGILAKLEPEFGECEFGQTIQSLVYNNWQIVPPAAQQFVIAADRSHRYLGAMNYSATGGNVIFDRHLMSSAVYQGVAIKRNTNEMWGELEKLYGSSFSKPDLTLVLDASLETVIKRGGDDVQTVEFLREARKRYLCEVDSNSVKRIDAELPIPSVLSHAIAILKNGFGFSIE